MLTVDYELLRLKAGQKLLDAGAGAGRHTYEAYHRGAFVWSLDYCNEELKKICYGLFNAENSSDEKERRWQIVLGDVLNLPFSDSYFDRIICSEVLEHLHEDKKALNELKRVLKPGGIMAITVPTYLTEYVYGKLSWLYFNNPGGHVRKFSAKELENKIRLVGLRIYAIRFAHSFHSLYWFLRCCFGLENEDHPVARAYRWWLVKGFYSPTMKKIEKLFDYICPKSIIYYVQKPDKKGV